MTPNPTRRRVLQLGGVGATASLAGCSQFGLSGDDTDELDAGEEPDIDPADGIAAVVQPPQEELQAIEQDVMQEAQEDGLDQMEAREEMIARQQELFLERSIELESELADDDAVSVEAAIGEQGIFLLDASEERLIDTLRNGEVDALLPGDEYATALEARQQAPPEEGADPEADADDGEDDPEETEGDDDDDDSGDDSASDAGEEADDDEETDDD